MKNKSTIIMFILLLLFLSSCKLTNRDKQDRFEAAGTDGLVMRFLQNSPPDKIIVGTVDSKIRIIIEARNKGAYPESDTKLTGGMHLAGFDKNVITMTEGATPYSIDLGGKFLPGRSALNPVGGFDLFQYNGKIQSANIPAGRHTQIFSVTACYNYETHANPQVCIDPDPYGITENKVCQIKPISLSSQGAPVAVTRVEENVLGDKIYFTIYLKNVGGGDVLDSTNLANCNPTSATALNRDDFDVIEVGSVTVSGTPLTCNPLTNQKMRLIDGEGLIICHTDNLIPAMKTQRQGFTTPLQIKLLYTYRSQIQKQIEIIKLQVGEAQPRPQA